jgi:hypothetical protein
MMTHLRDCIALTVSSFLFAASAAFACSPAILTPLYFDFGSASLGEKYSRAALGNFAFLKSVNPKCAFVVITASADQGEGGEPLASKRLDAAKRFFIEAGFLPNNIQGDYYGSAVALPRDVLRQVVFQWRWGKGKMRCDPATKSDPKEPGTTCGRPNYHACYLELEDGTVCNINNVPDPRPARYSVIDQ